jgi:hypothetical protein
MVEDLGCVARVGAGDDGSAWAPTEAMAVTSAARPPAPLGSLALNTKTQAGLFAIGFVGRRAPEGAAGELGFVIGRIRGGGGCARLASQCLDTIVAFYAKAL